jgi:hypothetical protein
MNVEEFRNDVIKKAKFNLTKFKELIPICFFLMEKEEVEGAVAMMVEDINTAPNAIKFFSETHDEVRAYLFLSSGWVAQIPEYFQKMMEKGVVKMEDYPSASEALNKQEVITLVSKERYKPTEQVTIFFERLLNGDIRFGRQNKTCEVQGRFADLI